MSHTDDLGVRRVKSQEAACAFVGQLLRSKRLIPEAGKQDSVRATAIQHKHIWVRPPLPWFSVTWAAPEIEETLFCLKAININSFMAK